jgi:hypothetical protein
MIRWRLDVLTLEAKTPGASVIGSTESGIDTEQ